MLTLISSVLICILAVLPAPDRGREDAFVSALMSRMTLEEKIGQLNLPVAKSEIVTGTSFTDNLPEKIRRGEAGAVFNVLGYDRVMAYQKIAVEESRLGIPLIFGLDVIHGYKTIFPVPLGLASSWNMALVEQVSRVSATEAAADGVTWLYGPMVDVSRDPRWGRCVESPGEDPYMNGEYAAAAVKGIQGDLLSDSEILACVKHFALYGASESGRDYKETDMSPDRMYNAYLPPYYQAIKAGAASVMSSFNDINGCPASANKWLLTEVLRRQWGFGGFVVSDYNSVAELSEHGLGSKADVAAQALSAGMDMEMVTDCFASSLKKLVQEGSLDSTIVDIACRRVLEAKCRLGLFNDPYKFIKKENASRIYTPEAKQLAYRAACESFVLLKNRNILPIGTGMKIALTGPFAAAGSQYTGSWSAKALENYPSLLDAMKTEKGIELMYARGSNIEEDPQFEKTVTHRRKYVRDDRPAGKMLAEALRVAKRSDVVVACLGEGAYATGESNCRTSLMLPDCQKRLLEALVATGKPVVLVLFSGRPLALEWENDNLAAILDVWYGGSEAGRAICDVLLGRVNPSGKLTMTFPRSVGQIPVYYGYRPLGRPNKEDDLFHRFRSSWLDSRTDPLYPFGYGLSYTSFEYSDITLDTCAIGPDQTARASVTVTNTGTMDGYETVQLYIRDLVSSSTRPVKELKGFRKVFIPAGESVTVSFSIGKEQLAWYYVDQYNLSCNASPLSADKTVEPGQFSIMIGPDSRTSASAVLTVN